MDIELSGALDLFTEEYKEVIDVGFDSVAARSEGYRKANARVELESELKKVAEGTALKKRLQKELAELEHKENLERLKEEAETSQTLAERQEKKMQLIRQQNAEGLQQKVLDTAKSGLDKLYSGISAAAQTYSKYVDEIQTRLLGANESYASIAAKLTVAFGSSPFFQMQQVMAEVSKAVNAGISFNVEARAAMEVLSDKVANTFNAFDSSLLRLIRIQQADSTQARLGMESLLTEFLNKQYQDTSYLVTLSKQVTGNLVEAQSLMGKDESTEFEYAIQKWLGSLSSVGVSDQLVTKLSQGLGMLGSGDVSGLSGDSSLEQLLVASANRGGANYGEMLTGTVTVDNVEQLMRGLYSLVTEISSSGNVVALNQYAKVFGMTVSDIRSMLNITSEGMNEISSDLKGYGELVQRVVDETSFAKLFSRTGGASIGDNLYQNFLGGAGQIIGKNAATYLGWEMADVVSGLLKGVETGVDIQPFGVGTHLNLTVGEIIKAATVSAGTLTGIASMMAGLGSLGGVNVSSLQEGEGSRTGSTAWTPGGAVVSRGGGAAGALSSMSEGTVTSQTIQVSDFSDSALVQSSNAATQTATAQYSDADFDAEKEKTAKTAATMEEIGDNVAFIVRMLNETGIVIRGAAGWTTPDTLFDDVAGATMATVLGGR